MKILTAVFLLLVMHSVATFGTTYQVKSVTEFEQVSKELQPGDEIIILKGTYENWAVNIDAKGTASKPIVISGEAEQATIFSGIQNQCIFKITGAYIILKNLRFDKNKVVRENGNSGTLIELSESNHCSVERCSFIDNESKVQFLPLVIISGNGAYNGVEACEFRSNINSIDLQVKITEKSVPQNTVIKNNVFRNKAKVSWPNGNGGECVQIGQDPILLGNQEAFSLVSKNKFINCNAENEVISNKSSKNIYLKNYFQNNDGELVMRGGHDCLITGNVFRGGTGGIRVNGTGHKITNNDIRGIKTAIRLMYGMSAGKNETGFYMAASGCSITNNKITNAQTGILEGDGKNIDWTGKFDVKRYPSRVLQDVAPFDNTLSNNKFSGVTVPVSKQ